MQAKDFLNKSSVITLTTAAAIAPIMSFFSPMSITIWFVLSAIFPAIILLKNENLITTLNKKNHILIAVSIIYAFCSAFWAIELKESLSMLVRLSLLYFLSIGLVEFIKNSSYKTLNNAYNILILSVIFTLGIANIEIISNGAISSFIYESLNKNKEFAMTDFNRGAAFLSIIIWPCLLSLSNAKKHNKIKVLSLYSLCAFTLFNMESQSAVLAFILGTIGLMAIYLGKKKMLYFIGLSSIIAVFLVAYSAKKMDAEEMFKALPKIEGSASQYRLYIWDYTAEKASQKPILGWGLNSARSFPVTKDEFLPGNRHPLPLHPHNNVLQIWLELGAIGLALFASFLFLITLNIAKIGVSNSWQQASFMSAIFMAYFGMGEVGFGIWQNWWVSSALLALGFISINHKKLP